MHACVRVCPQVELGKLAYRTGLPPRELNTCMAIFKLMDTNDDGFLAVRPWPYMHILPWPWLGGLPAAHSAAALR